MTRDLEAYIFETDINSVGNALLRMRHANILIFLSMLTIFTFRSVTYASEGNPPIVHTASWWDQATYENKVNAVKSVINHYKENGVTIRKDSGFYVSELDLGRMSGDPKVFVTPIGEHLKTLFIMYRDFGNTENPEDLIREVLGEDEYRRYVDDNSAETLEMNYQQWLQR